MSLNTMSDHATTTVSCCGHQAVMQTRHARPRACVRAVWCRCELQPYRWSWDVCWQHLMGQPLMVLMPGLLAGLPRCGATSTSTDANLPGAGCTETTARRRGPTVDRSTPSPRVASAPASSASSIVTSQLPQFTGAYREGLNHSLTFTTRTPGFGHKHPWTACKTARACFWRAVCCRLLTLVIMKCTGRRKQGALSVSPCCLAASSSFSFSSASSLSSVMAARRCSLRRLSAAAATSTSLYSSTMDCRRRCSAARPSPDWKPGVDSPAGRGTAPVNTVPYRQKP